MVTFSLGWPQMKHKPRSPSPGPPSQAFCRPGCLKVNSASRGWEKPIQLQMELSVGWGDESHSQSSTVGGMGIFALEQAHLELRH